MGTAGDIRARLRAKFSRRNSAAPSLTSTNGDAHSSQPADGTSLTRQSSTAGTASSSQHPHPHSPSLHQPHHQPQPHSTLQPPGSPADHLLQQRLEAITDTDTGTGTPHTKQNADRKEQQYTPPSSPEHQQKHQRDNQIHHGSQDDASHRSCKSLVTELDTTDNDRTGSSNSTSSRNRDTGEDPDAHKPHSKLDLPAPMPPAASDQRLASEPMGNDLRSSTTTTATATSNNLPSIHEDKTLVASSLQPFVPIDQKEISPLPQPHQPPPPKIGAAPTVTLEAVYAEDLVDDQNDPLSHALGTPTPLASNILPTSPLSQRPDGPPRRQSLLPNRQTTLIRNLLEAQANNEVNPAIAESLLPNIANMVTRKVWVRRPGASPTIITINEDDLVDDVRDMILRKYANSLGRHFDSPDLTLRICPREQRQDRLLGPEEPMCRTLDAYFPGGQNVDEALIIDIPSRRTPRPSPRAPTHATTIYYNDDGRPSEAGEGYFPPVAGALPSPNLPVPVVAPVTVPATHPAHPIHAHVQHTQHAQHSIAVLGTGQIPLIPSPGGTRSRAYRERPERPRLGRTHTSSPTILNQATAQSLAAAAAAASHPAHSFHPRLPPSRTHSNTSEQSNVAPPAPPLPTPPAPEVQPQRVATPPPRVASPRPASSRPKKTKKNLDHPTLPAGILNGGVPPINVLIVEDNPINLKLLEAFVKRLKVRWKTAVNGRDAVTMWRTGGFHLVLMDIQLPIMSGLDATREIRRLERVNSIGVFSSSASSVPEALNGEPEEKDKLTNMELFKSPVIIVALTASSLQSDRHEALAAGCNDFLTKPVNFVWLERKVMEWGCMQALIDFDGWRRWKDFSQQNDEIEAAKKSATLKTKAKKNRLSMTSVPA
ncbi:hypothetical protein EsH8_VIII_000812 [Colletotrichum jinshuiense]